MFQVLHEDGEREREPLRRVQKTLHRPLPADLGHPFRPEVPVRKVQSESGKIRNRRS